jgi:hypothetical protein
LRKKPHIREYGNMLICTQVIVLFIGQRLTSQGRMSKSDSFIHRAKADIARQNEIFIYP